MIGKTEFSVGLGRIAIAVRQTLDAETVDVYHEALREEIDAIEFERFSRAVVKAGRFEWFPKLRELQDALREFRGEPPLLLEATEAYERVLESGVYTPEGTVWTYREIKERCGRAAAEAFLEAGGHNAFASTWEESKRREKFVTAYTATAREVPASRLLPTGSVKALPPAEAPISRDEASQIMRQVADVANVAPTPKPAVCRLTQEEWDARVERVKRQAAEIVADEAVKG